MATKNAINSNIPIEISKGGTNATSMTDTDGVVYYDGTRLVTTAVGTATHVLTSNGSGVAPTFQAAAGGGGLVVTKFTSSGTWTKNGSSQAVSFILISAGSGGGSGRRGTDGASGGGAGGAGASGSSTIGIPAVYFGATETVTVPAGGSGGAAQTVNDSNGNDGAMSGRALFGGYQTADPSGVAGGGTTGDVTGKSGYATFPPVPTLTATGLAGKGKIIAGVNGTEQGPTSYTIFFDGAAGGGAGADSGTPYQGGSGAPRTRVDTTVIIAASAGGIETGTINGTAGTSESGGGLGIFTTGTGGGGGGGQSSGGAAGIGGAGGVPGGGGGGGGGSINGTNSGAGGDGARGEVWVIEYLG